MKALTIKKWCLVYVIIYVTINYLKTKSSQMAGLSLNLASAEKDLTILFGCVNCSQQNLSMTEMKTDPFSG